MALSVTDRGYVLENGEIRYHSTAEELKEQGIVKKAYLGGKRLVKCTPLK
jgi:branched-chain amino acid transport system ATP-binding protein